MSKLHGPLLELTLARIREFVRDPGALFWTFGFPIVLAVALGLAFRAGEPPKLRARLVCDGACEDLRAQLAREKRLEVEIGDRESGARRLRQGKVDVMAVFSGEKAGTGALEFHFDVRRPEGLTARLLVGRALEGERAFAVREVHDEQPGARYIDFVMPALLGLNLMGSAVWGIGFGVVEARKRKLLKQLAATPMKRSHYLGSLMLSRLVFLFAELVALLGFGVLVFGLTVQGSLGAVLLVSIVGALSFTGLALLIAATPRSPEAAAGWANLLMLPMWLLSGVFFSYERFPAAAQPFIRALPLTALNDALRSIINDGAALSATTSELFVLAAWGIVSFAVALKIFRWQ